MLRLRAGWRALRVSAVACTLWLAAIRPSSAQDVAEAAATGEPPAAYYEAITRAVDEHERGHFEEAREHYREAHELFPNARTLRGLGKVEFELRNYGESVRNLGAALGSTVRPLDAALRTEVEGLLERARAYVGEVHLEVQPGTATVSVDGVLVEQPQEVPFELLVGDHVFEFRAAGRLPERRHVSVRGRDRIDIHVTLALPEASARPAPLLAAESPGDRPVYKRWWAWTAVGVVVAGAATAVALSVRDRSHSPRTHYGTDWAVANP